MEKLTTFASSQPHAAYATFTHGLSAWEMDSSCSNSPRNQRLTPTFGSSYLTPVHTRSDWQKCHQWCWERAALFTNSPRWPQHHESLWSNHLSVHVFPENYSSTCHTNYSTINWIHTYNQTWATLSHYRNKIQSSTQLRKAASLAPRLPNDLRHAVEIAKEKVA